MIFIYKRYLLSKMLKLTTLLLFCFSALYIIIDYSLHSQALTKLTPDHFSSITVYYFFVLIKRLDTILPLIILIATAQTLLSLNHHLELVALQVAHLSIKELLKPFLYMALAFTAILYLNYEFFLPPSLQYIDHFESQHFKKLKASSFEKSGVYVLPTKNSGRLFFSQYLKSSETFQDVYLYFSQDNIWKMSSLKKNNRDATGFFVDKFSREANGFLKKTDSFDTYFFKDLSIEFTLKKKPHLDFESEKLSLLFKKYFSKKERHQNKDALLTHLIVKLFMPWIPFYCIIAISPFCLRFSRNLSSFKVYSSAFIIFASFFTLIDICIILSESSIFPPLIIMPLPFVLITLTFGWLFLKKC